MAAFIDKIEGFYGTGETNSAGQGLAEFLEGYDASQYESPCVTADIMVFKKNSSGELQLLMIKRKNHPCIGYWALPGGFVEMREDLLSAAKRELEEETHLTGVPIEQLYTWGEYERDPRTRIITTSFLAYIEEEVNIQAGDDAADAIWMDVSISLVSEETLCVEEKERVKKVYEIILKNQNKQLNLCGTVAVSENKSGILKEAAYEVLESKGIGFDHPRMIVQGLLHLKERTGL